MEKAKKIYTCLFVIPFLFIPFITKAQFDDSRVGIKGGVNLSNFYTSDIGSKNAKLGFNAGLFTELAVGEYFSIQPEVLLTTKGNSVTYGGDEGIADFVNAEGDVKFNLTYLEIPVLAKATIGEVLNLHIGPYASYLIGASTDVDGTFDTEITEIDRDRFNTWDYGLAVGIGADLEAVTIGVRYDLGLAQVADGTISEALLSEAKNSVLQAYIAVGL